MIQPSDKSQHQETKVCTICLRDIPVIKIIQIVEFQSHVCPQCYNQQQEAIMIFKKNKPTLYPQINLITEGLYLGNQDAACHQELLKSLNIEAVLVCGYSLLKPFTDKLLYKQFLISDSLSQQIIHMFDESYEWIQKVRQENKNILVHCAAGVSRSASFVIAYLMKSQNISYTQAYSFVKQKRPIIRPNSNFVKQLETYQKQLSPTEIQQKNTQ